MCAGINFHNESLIHERITRSRCFISTLKYFVNWPQFIGTQVNKNILYEKVGGI